MNFTTDIAALTITEQAYLWLRGNLMDIVGGIAVLVIGLMLASFISRWVSKGLNSKGLNGADRLDSSVSGLLANLVKYALWVVVLVTVLTQFGVETTSIIAALGGAALAVGLALQGTLSNVASGVMIWYKNLSRLAKRSMWGRSLRWFRKSACSPPNSNSRTGYL